MGYSAVTLPNQYMAGYSSVPLKLFDTQYNQVSQYKYLVNAVYDTSSVISAATSSYNGSVYTLLQTSTPHKFSVGDSILLDDAANNNLQTGYYNILSIPASNQLIIDLFPSTLFINFPIRISKFYKWKLTPDLDGYGKLDMSNVMKDLVSQNLTGQSVNYGLSYEGTNTKKCFGLLCGYESQYVFDFEDNFFYSGNVAFYNSTITSLNNTPFEVGDVIQIQQNPVAWAYTGITNDGYNFTRYSSSQPHSFLVNQTVQVQGQTSITSYNGYATVKAPNPTLTTLNTFQPFVGNSTTPGYIYGIPRPSYNTTAIITNIYIDPTYGMVVATDIAWAGSSVPISGSITYPGNVLTQVPNEYIDYDAFCVYNAHVDRSDYTIDFYDKYVVQTRSFSGNNISTILNQSNCYRIEPSTIGFLLTHAISTTYIDGLVYTFYQNGTILGVVRIEKPLNSLDWYSPIGLEQIGQSTYINVGGTFSSYSGSVTNYEVYGYDSTGPSTQAQRTNSICFKLNGDCSMYEVYHLMWKDKYGSFISYPFIYMSRPSIESDKKTYYQQEGKWDNNTFGYDDYGVGEKTFYQRSRESIVLNSGWLYEFETELIKDLIQSPSVYIQTPSNKLYSCHLEESKVELFKNINEQLFSYTFNVRTSNNEFRF